MRVRLTARASIPHPRLGMISMKRLLAGDLEDSARYGRLVTTLAVPGRQNRPHHTEHEMPAERQLFANGLGSGETSGIPYGAVFSSR